MADLNYKVAVDTADATRSITGLKSALGGLAAAFSIRQITQFGDSITNLQNKLRTLTPSTGLVEQQFRAIADIAAASRSNLAATGDLYFRIARSADQLGISLAEAASITDSLAKGLASSGMSAAESAGPLLQIGQALQSGRFQGDELRSVLEGMPVVARALADELGVPIGALRKLGSEGKITSDVFVRAMQRARVSIDEAFNRTLPTVSQSFNVLQTSFARFFAEFDRSTGTTQGLGSAIQKLATGVDTLTRNIDQVVSVLGSIITAVAAAGAAFLVFTRVVPAIASVIDAMTNLRKAIAAAGGVTGALGTGLGNLGRASDSLIGSWTRLIKGQNTLFGALANTVGVVGRLAARFLGMAGIVIAVVEGINALTKAFLNFDIVDAAIDRIRGLGEWLGILKKKQEEVAQGQQADVRRIDNAIDAYNRQAVAVDKNIKLTDEEILKLNQAARAYYDKVQAMQADLVIRNSLIGASEREIAVTEALAKVAQDYAAEAIRLTDAIAEARAKGGDTEQATVAALTEQLQRLTQSYAANADSVRVLVEEQQRLTEARQLSQYSIQQEIDQQKQLRQIQDDIAKSSMSEIERKYYDIRRAAEESAIAAIKAEEARRGEPLSTAEIENYYAVARRGVEDLIEANRVLYEQSRTFEAGWSRALREYADEASNAARRAESLFRKATQGMEDAIVQFARTGKFSFRDLLNTMLEELLRSQVRSLMAQIFGAGTGGGGGGGNIFSFFGRMLGFASGGIIPTNSPVLVGERGPEIISGAAGRVVTPNNQLAGGQTVVYNITAVDAPSFQALVARDPAFIHAVAQQGARSAPMTRR